MTDLKTTFAGLSLRNPIIISSSGLTNSVGKNKKLAEDGAGAIVLKSLFEEQIMLEADQLKDPAFYPEASDYLEEYIREHKLSEYLTLIKESKKVCPIPIIASINCYTDSEWIDFAKKIEEAGADALEINDRDVVPLSQTSAGLVLYGRFINLRKGDRVRFTASGPEGDVFEETTAPLKQNMATYVAFAGRRRGKRPWASGHYEGGVQLLRDGGVIAASLASTDLK